METCAGIMHKHAPCLYNAYSPQHYHVIVTRHMGLTFLPAIVPLKHLNS